ncbi:leucyl/phenylalanyl-tRNA--protein transferase [Thalassotalea crassostreae]|uniref:leucyl/phenylalanyl-tRNA--protein transferase n=1 Tax=Thalassotalea crassostreae TaxID=1763536 RepID=UPI0008392C7B|nr:leucyl/phenylalanyl-tRNA--protein transferase [Thalassotalea crassostreae]
MNLSLVNLDLQLASDMSFPSVKTALTEPNGLLAVGGDLHPQRLLNAYANGIFPWYSELDPFLWWSPDPRCIIKTDEIYINKSLAKFIRKCDYTVTINNSFERVINICSDAPFRQDDTWILPEMIDAYLQLHSLGYAHSIEVWQGSTLVGGLYGIAINGYFSGESMFYLKPNASKIALVSIAKLLNLNGINFIDCQIENPFLSSMGAVEVKRDDFIELKNNAIKQQLGEHFWQPREIQFNE